MLIKSSKIILALILCSASAFSAEKISLPLINFELMSSNVHEKMELVLMSPENMLKRYRPSGAKITKKYVDRSQVQFYAEKTVYLYTKKVFIKGYFTVEKNQACVSKDDTGYIANMDLFGSDLIITDNIEKYTAQICVSKISQDKAFVKVKANLHKSFNYSSIVGPIITDILSAQTGAFIEAITDEVKSIK